MAKPKKEVLLNHREAAKRLGVHPGTVHRYISNGSLAHVRLPSNSKTGKLGAIRIKQSDLSRVDEFYRKIPE